MRHSRRACGPKLLGALFPAASVLGAVVLFTFQELVWAHFIYARQVLLGAIIIAVVLAMPRGVLGALQQKYNLPRTL